MLRSLSLLTQQEISVLKQPYELIFLNLPQALLDDNVRAWPNLCDAVGNSFNLDENQDNFWCAASRYFKALTRRG